MSQPVDADGIRVLVVCSANVCRSPLATLLLRRALDDTSLAGLVDVESAGVDVVDGTMTCPEADAWAGQRVPAPAPVPVTPEALEAADLVLAMDQHVRDGCARTLPAVRSRLFLLTHAAFLASTVTHALRDGALPEQAPPLPADTVDRLRWLVGEMDAARFDVAGREDELGDIADHHGPEPHDDVFEEIQRRVVMLGEALVTCATTVDLPGA